MRRAPNLSGCWKRPEGWKCDFDASRLCVVARRKVGMGKCHRWGQSPMGKRGAKRFPARCLQVRKMCRATGEQTSCV